MRACERWFTNRRETFNLKNDFSLSHGKRKRVKVFFSPASLCYIGDSARKWERRRTPKNIYGFCVHASEITNMFSLTHTRTWPPSTTFCTRRFQTGGCLIPCTHTPHSRSTSGTRIIGASVWRHENPPAIAHPEKTGPSSSVRRANGSFQRIKYEKCSQLPGLWRTKNFKSRSVIVENCHLFWCFHCVLFYSNAALISIHNQIWVHGHLDGEMIVLEVLVLVVNWHVAGRSIYILYRKLGRYSKFRDKFTEILWIESTLERPLLSV